MKLHQISRREFWSKLSRKRKASFLFALVVFSPLWIAVALTTALIFGIIDSARFATQVDL